MSTKPYSPITGSAERPLAKAAVQMIASAVRWSSRVWRLRRQRKALASLDNRLLRDVGLTHDDVRQELKKPFWR